MLQQHTPRIAGEGIQDANGNGVDHSCFVLLSDSVFGKWDVPNQTSDTNYSNPGFGKPVPKPNLYGMWCTRDGFLTGLGWLPLKLQRAADLLKCHCWN